jgi:hypothetical protein
MDQLFRLKNTVVDYLSPLAKRRRTISPTPATPAKETEHTLLTPASEPTVFSRFRYKYHTSSDTKNPRKRGRTEFEGDGSGVSPDDSVSQVNSEHESAEFEQESGGIGFDEAEGSGDAGGLKLEEAIEEDIEEDEIEEVDQDAVAQVKVQEYLERQAELEMRREDIEKARAAGDWHTDELFLFERLTMRSFEELIPLEWKIDFPTLPELLFTDEPAKTFINYNCNSSARGELLQLSFITFGF